MESTFSQWTHGLSLATTITILVIILKQHKIWIRLKERVDGLWSEYCEKHDIRFDKIDNGH